MEVCCELSDFESFLECWKVGVSEVWKDEFGGACFFDVSGDLVVCFLSIVGFKVLVFAGFGCYVKVLAWNADFYLSIS